MIKKTRGSFLRVGYTGSGLSAGEAAALDSSGNAVKADNTSTPFQTCVGFVRHLETSHAILQVGGELQLSSTVSGQEYWLSSSGNISNTVPSSGIIQKVGIGLPNNKILVRIDTDIIDI